jgi:hypothetical protein
MSRSASRLGELVAHRWWGVRIIVGFVLHFTARRVENGEVRPSDRAAQPAQGERQRRVIASGSPAHAVRPDRRSATRIHPRSRRRSAPTGPIVAGRTRGGDRPRTRRVRDRRRRLSRGERRQRRVERTQSEPDRVDDIDEWVEEFAVSDYFDAALREAVGLAFRSAEGARPYARADARRRGARSLRASPGSCGRVRETFSVDALATITASLANATASTSSSPTTRLSPATRRPCPPRPMASRRPSCWRPRAKPCSRRDAPTQRRALHPYRVARRLSSIASTGCRRRGTRSAIPRRRRHLPRRNGGRTRGAGPARATSSIAYGGGRRPVSVAVARTALRLWAGSPSRRGDPADDAWWSATRCCAVAPRGPRMTVGFDSSSAIRRS